MKILSVSDEIDPRVYSDTLADRYGDVEFVVSCGDLSYDYLEYILTVLNRPLYFVHGNHDKYEVNGSDDGCFYPRGADNLHRKIIHNHGLILAGIEGCIQYSGRTKYQYSQGAMWFNVFSLIPGLLFNRIRYGRYLDVFITHAPPRGVHEGEDWAHQGINAFRWLIDTFQPRLHFHGHVHYYRPDEVIRTRLGKTLIINTYRSQTTEID